MALPYDVTVEPVSLSSFGFVGAGPIAMPDGVLIEGIAVTTFGFLWPNQTQWYVCSFGVTTSWTSCGAAPSTTWTPC